MFITPGYAYNSWHTRLRHPTLGKEYEGVFYRGVYRMGVGIRIGAPIHTLILYEFPIMGKKYIRMIASHLWRGPGNIPGWMGNPTDKDGQLLKRQLCLPFPV